MVRVGHIHRTADSSGVSGVGRVAEWVEYSDGTVVVRWISNLASTNIHPNMKAAESVHGHPGTEFVTDWDQRDHVTGEPEKPEEDPAPDVSDVEIG